MKRGRQPRAATASRPLSPVSKASEELPNRGTYSLQPQGGPRPADGKFKKRRKFLLTYLGQDGPPGWNMGGI